MNCEDIYINYKDYPILDEEFETALNFATAVENAVDVQELGFISSDDTTQTKLQVLMYALAYPIYDEYQTDRLAYKDDQVFMKRLVNSISRKINRWYIQKKIEEDLISNATLTQFIANGGTHSETSESSQSGSAVIQKSASTPTGITHNVSEEELTMNLSQDGTQSTMSVDDGYEDKYTNFVGKTDGLHKNEVGRDTDISRTSNYGLALEILEKIPYSYIEEVLKEVSQHFIQVY